MIKKAIRRSGNHFRITCYLYATLVVVKRQSLADKNLILIELVIVAILAVFVLIEWNRPRVGTIILPGGTTYLGPSQ